MHKNLEILLEVQGLELRLRELDAEVASLPRKQAASEARLAGSKQAVERAKAAESSGQSERRQVDREIESLKEKIAKIRSHSGDVKTNQEYRALLDEIAFAEAQIAKHEERLLEIMEQAEALSRAVKDAEAELMRQLTAVEAETKALAEQSGRDREERQRVAAQRDQLRGQADETWLRRFDRVLRMRGNAMAAVDREACSGCRVRQRPQFLQEMEIQPERLFVCESCGRILYLEAAKVSSD
ncbi:MAG TPA: C4-type zinc ribbon domain-containing protein [Terriglobales bacterium]|nr:C4-type zinc ribbon domain-containing protein [Terriglobales bacterium]